VLGEAVSWALTIIIVVLILILLHYVQIIPITAIRRGIEEITPQTPFHWAQKIPNNAVRERTVKFIKRFMDEHRFKVGRGNEHFHVRANIDLAMKERKATAVSPTEPTIAVSTSFSRAHFKGFLKMIGQRKTTATTDSDNQGTAQPNDSKSGPIPPPAGHGSPV
jgi:hypothetical protein